MPDGFSQRINLFRAPEDFTLEGAELVRRTGGREARWPLQGLTEVRLARHPLAGQEMRLTLQLRFGRRSGVLLTSHSLHAIGAFEDRGAAMKAFAREAMARALAAGAQPRLARAGALSAASLWRVIGALAVGAIVVAASAMVGGATALGLDLGARMVFLLLVVACALPWIERGGPGATIDELLADHP